MNRIRVHFALDFYTTFHVHCFPTCRRITWILLKQIEVPSQNWLFADVDCSWIFDLEALSSCTHQTWCSMLDLAIDCAKNMGSWENEGHLVSWIRQHIVHLLFERISALEPMVQTRLVDVDRLLDGTILALEETRGQSFWNWVMVGNYSWWSSWGSMACCD